MTPYELTAQHRARQLALRTMVLRELLGLWPTLDPARTQETYPGWLLAVAALVRRSRGVSSTLATEYLREHRAVSGIDEDLTVVDPAPLDPRRLETALRVTSLVSIRRSLAAGQRPEQAARTAFVTSSGSATRLALEGGRETVRLTSVADPRARGWARVTGAEPCEFCSMIASRGGVFTEATADFQAHDGCGCAVEPVWR